MLVCLVLRCIFHFLCNVFRKPFLDNARCGGINTVGPSVYMSRNYRKFHLNPAFEQKFREATQKSPRGVCVAHAMCTFDLSMVSSNAHDIGRISLKA